jgi:phage tail P2-like protein
VTDVLVTNWGDSGVWDDNARWGETVKSLLPSANAGNAERAIEQVSIRAADFPDLIRQLWSPGACPIDILPWLAWSFSVDEWDAGWPEDRKREVTSQSVWVHRHKGTIGAVKRAVAAAGFGDAIIQERKGATLLDGSRDLDGSWYLARSWHWAEYSVTLMRPITNEQAAVARRIIEAAAPLRCHLRELNFTEVARTLDGTWQLDGSYNMGVA